MVMAHFLRDLFSDKGSVSMVRVMSFIAILISGYVAIYGLNSHADLNGLAMLCGVFLSAAFAGKVSQKMVETKITDKSINQSSEDIKG
jgi:hypothetical protein